MQLYISLYSSFFIFHLVVKMNFAEIILYSSVCFSVRGFYMHSMFLNCSVFLIFVLNVYFLHVLLVQ